MPVNFNLKLLTFDNFKLRTFMELKRLQGRDLPLFIARCELDAGSGATEVQLATRRDAVGITPRLAGVRRRPCVPVRYAEDPGAPASGSCSRGC